MDTNLKESLRAMAAQTAEGVILEDDPICTKYFAQLIAGFSELRLDLIKKRMLEIENQRN